jgi:hypothetical protein
MAVDWRLTFQIIGACVIGSASAWMLAPNALDAPSSNIVSALSIVNAAIFPTVVLSATVLKSNGLNRSQIQRYRSALHTQVSFFFGILLFSLLTIGVVIVAQALKWKLTIEIPGTDYLICLDGIFNFLIMFLGSFVALRLPAFLRALVSLLDVHIDGVADEVEERAIKSRESRQRELDALPDIAHHQLPPEKTPIGS